MELERKRVRKSNVCVGQDAIITFSPYATDFGPIGGSAAGGPGTLGM